MSSRGLAILSEADCYDLLHSQSLGRVGVRLTDDLVILPVYYAVLDEDVVFRTDPGTKLNAALLGTRVAFEVDSASPGWSVLVVGHAREIRATDEKAAARARLGHDWPAGKRECLVRIAAERVTGRRLPPRS
jgi:nitroimidazol reductase NimA-like FMN-containing flavoprotein (pyridoxamine 5'-phosphate oxidase superfamily)